MEKRIIKIILSLFLFIDIIYAEELSLYSDKYILYNMNEEEILTEKNSNEKAYIASLTKMMTIIVAIENIEDYNEKITITHEMIDNIEWDVAVAGFRIGEKLTYNDLLYGAMLPSGADAVNALAISVGGSYDNFVKMMNDKVSELGLKNTHFANVVGLFDEENYSSAYDVAEILKYSLKNEKFKEVFETKNYTFSNGKKTKSTIESYNSKGKNEDVSFITGGKTGYISAAGYCLATTATLNGVDYLLVTLNASKNLTAPHIKDAVTTYKYYDDNYEYKNIVSSDDIVVTLNTIYAKEDTIGIKAGVSFEDYLSKKITKENLKYEYEGINEISYFTEPGTKLGKITIKLENEVLKEFDLIYNQTLSFSILSFVWINKLYFIIGIVVLLLIFKMFKKKKRRK